MIGSCSQHPISLIFCLLYLLVYILLTINDQECPRTDQAVSYFTYLIIHSPHLGKRSLSHFSLPPLPLTQLLRNLYATSFLNLCTGLDIYIALNIVYYDYHFTHGPRAYCFLSPYPIIGPQHPFPMPLSFFWQYLTSVLAAANQHLDCLLPLLGLPLPDTLPATALERLHQPSHCPSVEQNYPAIHAFIQSLHDHTVLLGPMLREARRQAFSIHLVPQFFIQLPKLLSCTQSSQYLSETVSFGL